MILAEFENQGKCSKIKNVAPDPGSCTRETFMAAGQSPEFFVIRSSAARRPRAEATVNQRAELFSAAIRPAWLTAKRVIYHFAISLTTNGTVVS
jgi:hypothetical protein